MIIGIIYKCRKKEITLIRKEKKMSIKNKNEDRLIKFIVQQNEFMREVELYDFYDDYTYDTLDQKIEILDRSGVINAVDWNIRLAA